MDIDRTNLLRILDLLSPTLTGKDIAKATEGFHITPDYIEACNNSTLVRIPFKSDMSDCILPKDFLEILTRLPGEKVNIEINENELVFKSGRVSGKIKLLQLDYPVIELPTEGWKDFPDKLEIADAMYECKSVMFKGIYIDADTISATDSYQAIIKTIKTGIEEGIILDEKLVQLADRFAEIKQFKIIGDDVFLKTEHEDILAGKCYPKTGNNSVSYLYEWVRLVKQIMEKVKKSCKEIPIPESLKESLAKHDLIQSNMKSRSRVVKVKLDKTKMTLESVGNKVSELKEQFTIDSDLECSFQIPPKELEQALAIGGKVFYSETNHCLYIKNGDVEYLTNCSK